MDQIRALWATFKVTILAVVILGLVAFGGWNWWWKNVYHDALTLTATKNVQNQRAAEQDMQAKLNRQAEDLAKRSKTREETLERQLADAARSPAQRIEYRLRDRWLPVSCPSGASASDPGQATGGLQREDEQFLVRESIRADDSVDAGNACIDAYNEAREAILKDNKERSK